MRHSRVSGDITELFGDTPLVGLNHAVPPPLDRWACAWVQSTMWCSRKLSLQAEQAPRRIFY